MRALGPEPGAGAGACVGSDCAAVLMLGSVVGLVVGPVLRLVGGGVGAGGRGGAADSVSPAPVSLLTSSVVSGNSCLSGRSPGHQEHRSTVVCESPAIDKLA